jgi:pimeloyl-ACP methyl ester carboxylesterase
MENSHFSWRAFALKGLLSVVLLAACCALIEHVLERRDAARLTATETFYTEHGRRIRYHLTGPGLTGPGSPGPTIVLLNGSAGSLEQWDRVQTALSATSPVISYDRGGTGFNDPADAYDAHAYADELDQLLHSRHVAEPFVLVSYSSSWMLAIVFAAGHPDVVKGIVFVDPPLRSVGTMTYRRLFWRASVVNPLEALFGYTRLRHAIAARNAPPSSPTSERSDAVLVSTRHWVATTHDSMNLDDSADEADAAIAATHPLAHIPLALLTTADPAASEWSRRTFAVQKKLVESSEHGSLRAAVGGDHSQLLNDPAEVASIVAMIRVLASETPAVHAKGSSSPE